MTHNTLKQENWLQRHWNWLVPSLVIVLCIVLFFSSGMNKVTSDLTNAYTDTELYNKALEKVNANETVLAVLGEIEPIDKLAILEGLVNYSEANTVVKSSVRIVGTKGNARLDISATKVNTEWTYNTINVRIKQPKDLKQTIVILTDN